MAVHTTLSICRRLRLLREDSGLTQKRVALWLSISQAAYSRLESGEVELSLNKLILLSELYNIELTHLVQGL